MAAGFNGTSSMIRVSNHDYLNFSDRISLLTWIKTKKIIADEQFIISHGSWQNRYKVSITDKHLRFTINGAAGIVDLDSKTEIQPNTWLHVALVYNGRDMELYLNGELNSFKPWSGKLNMTSYDLTIGQMLPENPAYNFSGSLDDLRIFDYGIDKQTIGKIMLGEHIDEIIPDDRNHFTVYPNPAKDFVRLMLPANALVPEEIWLCSAVGNLVWHVELADISVQNNQLTLAFGQLNPGIYFIRFKHKGSWYAEKLLIY